jgi:hypothetical protein
MFAEAARLAMAYGATNITLERPTAKVVQKGDTWSVGIGGGASVLTGTGGETAIAPNGGLGIGSAEGESVARPSLVMYMHFDKELKITKLPRRAIRTKYDGRYHDFK